MYDPVIGRWLSPDPYGQYDSPYLAMGNDWANQVDPDGGWTDPIKTTVSIVSGAGSGGFEVVVTATRLTAAAAPAAGAMRAVYDFVGGFANAHLSNNTTIAFTDISWHPRQKEYVSDAFSYGQAAGDLVSIAQGAYQFLQGMGIAAGGAAGTAALVLPSGGTITVPGGVVVAGGAAIAAHGASTLANGLENLMDKAFRLSRKPKNRLPEGKSPSDLGPPGGKLERRNPQNGSLQQERWYDPDGKPFKDKDYGHDHGAGDPHIHDWHYPSPLAPNPVRGTGRPLKPGE
ncbi:MAG: hypothetical protein MUD08_13195 [Cytophagales bacterium]|jgi:hypothetical protein|nr:hypothetical protein [Cytophagales bacterium]